MTFQPSTVEFHDADGKAAGQFSCAELAVPSEILQPFVEEHFQILNDIRRTLPELPVLELKEFRIYENRERRRGDGRQGLKEFCALAKAAGYKHAITRIGKHAIEDSYEGNTEFYVKCGWKRFITPSEYCPRYAYFAL